MAGLLDFYDDPEQAARLAFGAGLLSAGGPQLRPVSVGQALASGLLASQQAGTEAAWNKRRGALTDMTIQEHQARQQAQQQAQAEALRKQEYLRSYLSQGVPSVAFNPGADPKMQNAPQLDPMTLAAAGFSPDEVAKIVSLPNAGRPEVKHWANTRGPDGSVSVSGFNVFGDQVNTGARPYVAPEFRDAGGKVIAIDPTNMGQLGQWGKTMTPDAAAADARARERMAWDREQGGKPVIQNVEGVGLVSVAPGTATATPVTMGGVPVVAKPKMSDSAREKFATNEVTIQKIDKALSLLDQNPGSVGLQNALGDTIAQRFDTAGVPLRAAIADIAGQKIHDRSGAAVTVGEAERLKPYVPNVTDTPEVVKAKLAAFRNEYQAMQVELSGGKSILDASSNTSGPRKITNDTEYNALPSGTVFVGPDGKQRRKP